MKGSRSVLFCNPTQYRRQFNNRENRHTDIGLLMFWYHHIYHFPNQGLRVKGYLVSPTNNANKFGHIKVLFISQCYSE